MRRLALIGSSRVSLSLAQNLTRFPILYHAPVASTLRPLCTHSSVTSILPNLPSSAYVKGLELLEAQDESGAKDMFLECVATDPKFTPALVELGVLAIRSKDGTAEAHKHLLAAHATFSDFVSSELSNSIPATVDLKLKGAAMHVCLAEVYKRYGDTLKQRRHLEFAVGLTPNNAAVRLALAELHLRGRQYESAVTQLLEVLSLKPHDRVTKTLLKNVYLGQALDCSERSDAYGAIAAYDKCLPLLDSDVHSSQGVEVRYNLAALHESVGNTMKALSLYRDAVGMDRSHWRARVALASLCHKLSQTSPSDAPRLQDEAIRLYTEALENDGCKEKDRVLYGLGLLYIARQEAERASEKFRAALTINPSLKEARLELSNVLLSEGNSGGAVYHLEEALRVDPNYGAARHNLYQINQRAAADKGKEGGDNFDMNKLEAGTRDALVAVGTAELAGRRGDFAAALSGYEKHLPTIAMVSDEYPALKEGLGAAYWNQGLMLQRLGQLEAGHTALIRAFETLQCLKDKPRTPNLATHVFSSLVASLVNQGDVRGAEKLCQDACTMRIMEGSSIPYFLLGTLNIYTSQLDSALLHFSKALEIEPYHAPSHFNSGNVYLRKHSESGDASLLGSAISHCRAAIAADDKAVHAHLFLGEALLRQGNEVEGLKAVYEALKIAPEFSGGHSILGNYLASKGQLAQATEHLRVAVRNGGEAMPEVRERDSSVLVMCLMRLNQPKEALTHCKALVALRPDAKQYKDLLSQLQHIVGDDEE